MDGFAENDGQATGGSGAVSPTDPEVGLVLLVMAAVDDDPTLDDNCCLLLLSGLTGDEQLEAGLISATAQPAHPDPHRIGYVGVKAAG